MRKIVTTLLFIALFAVAATALEVTSPLMGNDRHDRLSGVETTFTVRNSNASGNLTNIQVTFTAGAENAKYALQVIPLSLPSQLTPGETASLRLNGTIPLDHPGVNPSTLNEESIVIGQVTVTGILNGTQISQSANVFMQAVNQLRVKKVRVDCDNGKSKSLDDGDKMDQLRPGDKCTIEVEIENRFDDDDRQDSLGRDLKIGDLDIERLLVDFDLSNQDFDIDEDDDPDEIGPNDEETVTFELEIDTEADGSASADIRVSGTDENGAIHGESLSIRFEVERLSHDVQIRSLRLTPTRIEACRDSTVSISANVLNQGKRNEDEVRVEVTSPDINLAQSSSLLELDKDDSTGVSFDVVVPKNTKEGVVRFDVKSYYDEIAQSNVASVELLVENCGGSTEEEPPVVVQQPPVIIEQQPVVQQPPQQPSIPTTPVVAPRNSSFTDSPAYTALLAVISIIVAIIVIVLIVLLVRKK
ncbi:hypothetical protein COV18_07505 [Candidatus Woesearchaeota archaeon CG10_big_fil_rev_8_21_14_0_10_37_12]|nr:MAG: hypothetical protein COV18_07505 [Candidatus Woesearchaeota archaeon CG10_big_fil_rev_8_21_14_0_10_37_12]